MTSYSLGVDLGTTSSAATIHRGGIPEPVTLGSVSLTVPSIVFVSDEGLVVGEPAAEAGRREPERVARDFARLATSEPRRIAGRSFPPRALVAELLGWILSVVTTREGGPPGAVALAHPATWASDRRELLREVAIEVGIDRPMLLSGPEAVAVHHLAGADAPNEAATMAVFDLGDGGFEAAVVRCDDDVTVLGQPSGVDLGGADLDRLVFDMVEERSGLDLGAMEARTADVAADLAHLREASVRAKLVLSEHLTARVTGRVGEIDVDVRIVRGEFEIALRPLLEPTLDALARAIASAGVADSDVDRVLLVGGSSRIPVVGSMVRERFRCPPSRDIDPVNAAATGAAIVARRTLDERQVGTVATPSTSTPGHLLIRWDDGRELRVAPDRPYLVGRLETSDVCVDASVVSRDHGELRCENGWVYRDRGSSNGSYLLGPGDQRTRIEERRLVDGDVVSFGRRGPRLTFVVGSPPT